VEDDAATIARKWRKALKGHGLKYIPREKDSAGKTLKIIKSSFEGYNPSYTNREFELSTLGRTLGKGSIHDGISIDGSKNFCFKRQQMNKPRIDFNRIKCQ
jgi:hypothetical protein